VGAGADARAWGTEDADAESAGVRAAVGLFYAHHPYRALHAALPALLAARHPAARRFAWALVEAFVVRLERYPVPEPRHVASFGRIFRRYRGDALALGDVDAVVLFDRALAGAHVRGPTTGDAPASLSVFHMPATMEASEFAYAQGLAGRMLRGEDYIEDALAFLASTPLPEARDAGRALLTAQVVRLEAWPPSGPRRDGMVALFSAWRGALGADPAAAALLHRALAALT